tara:strand:- start:15312 stop:17150 length:1839 start_codon:yes stop_codon:yes gene_type:complete
LCITTIYAQDKLWEVNLNEKLYKVGWIEQTNDGLILAAGDRGLMALDNNTGTEVWFNETLKAVDKNTLLNIPELPMFYVEYVPIIGKTRGVLINSSNGDILFDTKDDGYRMKNFTIIPDEAMILFELIKDKSRYLMKFSLRTWEEEWITSVGTIKQNLLQKVLGNVSFIEQGPFFNDQGNMILGTEDEIYVINPQNGKIVWQQEVKKKIKTLVYSPINNNLYLGHKKNNKLIIFDSGTGEDIIPEKLKLKADMIDLMEDDDTDNLILVESAGFNLLDPETNTLKWKNNFKISSLSEVIPKNDKFYVFGKGEKSSEVAKVDSNGKKEWRANIRGYAYYQSLTDKGILYISTDRSNIIDYDTGKDVWKRDVKFRAIPAVTYDEQEDKVIIFENKNGYKFDLKTGDIDLFAQDIALKKVSRKTPLQAEFLEGSGYFLFTDQHVSLLSQDGDLVYSDYYTPPSSTNALFELSNLAGRMFLGVDIDIEGSIENINMLNSLSNGVYQNTRDQNGANSHTSIAAGLYVGSGGNMQTVFEITSTRYFNSKQDKDHQFIVAKTKDDTNTTTRHAIYMVRKATGQKEKTIDLLDKTPNYLVDTVDNRVFVNQNNELLTSYQF